MVWLNTMTLTVCSLKGKFMMRPCSILALVCSLAAAIPQSALADPQSADAALAKISCSVYGSESEEVEHNKIANELYLSGVHNLFEFLEAVEAGTVTAADLHSNVPMIVSWNLSGLTISRDFAAGSIVSSIVKNAADDYLKYSDMGDLEKYGELRDPELWPIVGANLFNQRNCSLLDRNHSIAQREFTVSE